MGTYIQNNLSKKTFTLAEAISVLTILGVVAAITIPSTIVNARNREFVTRAKKTYSALNNATELWMIEEGCVDNIQGCLANYKDNSPAAFDAIARNLNVVESTSYIFLEGETCEDGEENCKNGKIVLKDTSQNLNVDWLPDYTLMSNGSKQNYAWQGVSKFSRAQGYMENITSGYYLLKDGVTIMVQAPDNRGQSGFGLFDVNGKKGPNKIGVDVYPFGLGIKNPKVKEKTYGEKARNFNPYFAEDDGLPLSGVCNAAVSVCSDNSKDNPTSYLLINNKIPNQ